MEPDDPAHFETGDIVQIRPDYEPGFCGGCLGVVEAVSWYVLVRLSAPYVRTMDIHVKIPFRFCVNTGAKAPFTLGSIDPLQDADSMEPRNESAITEGANTSERD
jgi:hypothetical protein